MEQMNWEATYKANKALKPHRKIWTTRWRTKSLPIGTNLQGWQYQDHDLCPKCGLTENTQNHFITCQGGLENWEKALTQLEQHCIRTHTDPDLTMQIITHL